MHSLEGSPKLLLRNSSCGEPDEDVKELRMCFSYPSASTWHRVGRPSPKVFLGKIFKKSFPTGTRFREEADRNVCLGKKVYLRGMLLHFSFVWYAFTTWEPHQSHPPGIPKVGFLQGMRPWGWAKNVAKISRRNREGRAKQIVCVDHIIKLLVEDLTIDFSCLSATTF